MSHNEPTAPQAPWAHASSSMSTDGNAYKRWEVMRDKLVSKGNKEFSDLTSDEQRVAGAMYWACYSSFQEEALEQMQASDFAAIQNAIIGNNSDHISELDARRAMMQAMDVIADTVSRYLGSQITEELEYQAELNCFNSACAKYSAAIGE